MPSFAGAVILPDENRTLLFKNRDLRLEEHRDELFYDVDCFGVRGIDAVTDKVSGLAVGVNRHGLAAANTHVRNTEDPSCHILTEQILMFAKDAEDGLKLVAEHLQKGRKYQWGNLILADSDSMLVIEIAGSEHSVEWSQRKVLRTGHHIMLDTEDALRAEMGESEIYEASVKRVERGYDLIRQSTKIVDTFALLKDHGTSQGQESICRHAWSEGDLATAMSYVIEVEHNKESGKPRVVLHVANGNPCSSEYRSIPLVFPADEEIMQRATHIYFSE
ncbi:MAG: carcinine hydrolase/isopenicillin-N N-acyltransferase family protein [Candidatus Thorarchaeota archaeon]|nr:carcinine hydrolase/isopenicillin-N N-acyltransferase family protein [Candidatus Thorarchaeota archaeon]